MDYRDAPPEAAFRKEVRTFLKEELGDLRQPDDAILGVGTGEDERDMLWLKKLAKRGWVAPAWPKEYGGAGLSVMQQFVYNEELARAGAPRPNFLAIGLIGPTIIVHGNDEQKRDYLPGIMSGDVYWCQGFSEPGSGSDLASLQTKAVEDGDDFVINGQKIWTSGAHRADRMMLLARTDPDAPKHKGISCFVLDMKQPGVSVQPLMNMAETHSFNEVFFDNVRVPKKDMLGEINRGWYVATTTLDFERSGIVNAVSLEELLKEIAEATRPFWSRNGNGFARYELVDRFIETRIAIMFSYRIASMQAAGLIPNMEASIMKLFSSELAQRIPRTAVRLAGLYGQLGPGSPYAPLLGRIERMYRIQVGSTLAGGTERDPEIDYRAARVGLTEGMMAAMPVDLAARHCVPCEGGTKPLSKSEAEALLAQVERWKLIDGEPLKIARNVNFKDFAQAMRFVSRVAELAEAEGHHPDICISWNRVKLEVFTHAIGGLSDNDFILAAKINVIKEGEDANTRR